MKGQAAIFFSRSKKQAGLIRAGRVDFVTACPFIIVMEPIAEMGH